ncbi:phage protease [Actinomadura litoris]|uniref:Capsid maturation protease n=1 Tax=Actinomadura litoris TaxID=2678616 RepID=A0A7K1LAH4_9ACTN|nr:phage protease [Actinomadura litoris]MUN41414.1 hypothetical protein [Actinomadura litoris]
MTDPAPEVTVTVPPALVTVPNVELMHVGQWPISTGIANFTAGDLAAAVAALDCPAVRRPVLKLGHAEPDPDENGQRWDGEPAVGYIANMATVEGGQTLVGDYAGMPAWMDGQFLASAYPDRSIEGRYDHRCQLGHTHPFVITAVALLGVVPPGIGTLQSLQDVAALYDVAAATDPAGAGVPVAVTIRAAASSTTHAAREDAVPNPNPATVRAGVSTDDVRRAFYSSEYGSGWDVWICEMQLGPDLQLIVMDDSTGGLSRVPVTIGEGDGEDAVTFADPVKVVVRYEDAPAGVAAVAAASSRPPVLRYASRAESRPSDRPAAAAEGQDATENTTEDTATEPQAADPDGAEPDPAPAEQAHTDPPAATAVEGNHNQEGEPMDAALLRQALGLSPEATDDEVRTALTTQGITPTPPAPAGDPEDQAPADPEGEGGDAPAAPATDPAETLAPGTVTIDEAALAELREQALEGVAARAQQRREARDRALDDAIKAGKFPPVRRPHWESYWDKDETGAKEALASLAPGLVPVQDAGAPGSETDAAADASEFDSLFTRPVPATSKGA